MTQDFNDSVLVCIAPHPDDETLGCAGFLLRAKALGAKIYWVIITEVKGTDPEVVEFRKKRDAEIQQVSELYNFDAVYELKFESAALCCREQLKLIPLLSEIIDETQCSHLLVPYRNDIHSDHKIVHDAALSASKSFRSKSVVEILMYETLSETDFSIRYDDPGFKPNVFINIEDYLAKKIEILSIFESEIYPMPFPRSISATEALATLRGVQANVTSAEAFVSLKRIIK
ncbi:PIG-L family deacetylase [Amylibacter sp.]|nr:PIG-L family deacetylase [Amylibacter sp.]MDB9785472.1 PIG-L family deacetylase [Amylibacter sp.]